MPNTKIVRKSVTWLDGEPYVTAQAMGEMLGYKNPRRSINKIYNQNKPEFEGLVTVTDSVTVTGNHKTIAFNEEGAYLVTMLAKTPRAREARRQIAALMKAIRQERFVPREEYLGLQRRLAKIEIDRFLSNSAITGKQFDDIVSYFYRHNLTYREITAITGAGKATIWRVLRLYRQSVPESDLPPVMKRVDRPIGVCRGTHDYANLLLPGLQG